MKQIWIPRNGDVDVLEVRDAPDPTPDYGEVRVKVEAAGVNFADLMARIGVYPDAPPLPAVMGYEVAGKIDAVGPGVQGPREGDEVLVATRFGGYSTHVVVPADHVVRRAPGVDARVGASIPVTGLTAWMMLEELGRVREGDRVLVHSAGGGVGLMALDLILRRKAIAVGTASAKKHEFLKERGYTQLVDYTKDDYEHVLKDGPGFDIVLDPIGGASWGKGFRLLKTGGRLICFGMSANAGKKMSILRTAQNVLKIPWLSFNPITVINANKGVMGVNMGRLWKETARLTGWLETLLELHAQGVLRPRVHAAVPFSNAKEAHRILHDRENLGKVVLVPDEFIDT